MILYIYTNSSKTIFSAKKVLDKSENLCYNKGTVKGTGVHHLTVP
nr:MAG TPA: hypothetical protein [Caudoviricetes sp.]